MTIFKVSRHDKPSMKKLVKAETMTELVDAARVKLSLTENVYKIFMEDFTEIDDDDILQELATSRKEQLSLTLVPDGIEWSSDNVAKNTPTVLNENLETDNQPCQSLFGRQTSNLDSIYVKLPSSVQEFLSKGTFLDPDKKKSLIHVIEKYMSNDLKNTTRGTARDIGKQLVNKYPASFTVKNLSMDAAGASLGQKIYDRINYVKQDQIGNEASHSCSLQDLEEPARKSKVQDEYGCVAYMPELPSTETWESQERKRLELIEKYKSSEPVGDIKEFMSQTYYLQRKNIIRENRDLTKIFTDWPYLTHYKIMIAHADRLLGQNCLKIWGNSLEDFYVPINCFSKNKEICAIEKFKKKK